MVVKGDADAILGNDGDFPVYIGERGVAISDFKYDTHRKQLHEFTLSSGFGSVLQKATSSLSMSNDKMEPAEFPLLDGRQHSFAVWQQIALEMTHVSLVCQVCLLVH